MHLCNRQTLHLDPNPLPSCGLTIFPPFFPAFPPFCFLFRSKSNALDYPVLSPIIFRLPHRTTLATVCAAVQMLKSACIHVGCIKQMPNLERMHGLRRRLESQIRCA